MEDGLYKANFTGPLGSGTGVVVLANGKFNGGDSRTPYTGTLEQSGDRVTAALSTFRHSGVGVSVFGQDNVNVSLRGVSTSTGSATLKAHGVNFSVVLNRIAA
jgi:hypothetical protein